MATECGDPALCCELCGNRNFHHFLIGETAIKCGACDYPIQVFPQTEGSVADHEDFQSCTLKCFDCHNENFNLFLFENNAIVCAVCDTAVKQFLPSATNCTRFDTSRYREEEFLNIQLRTCRCGNDNIHLFILKQDLNGLCYIQCAICNAKQECSTTSNVDMTKNIKCPDPYCGNVDPKKFLFFTLENSDDLEAKCCMCKTMFSLSEEERNLDSSFDSESFHVQTETDGIIQTIPCDFCGNADDMRFTTSVVTDDEYVQCDECGSRQSQLYLYSDDIDNHVRNSPHLVEVPDTMRQNTGTCAVRSRTRSSLVDEKANPKKSITVDENIIFPRTRIFWLSALNPGDHVAFHRWYVIWHHGIVSEVDPDGQWIRMIHYSKGKGDKRVNVREDTVHLHPGKYERRHDEFIYIDPLNDKLYRCDYDECLDTWDVIDRARRRIGEKAYNFIAGNCEHFAHWCKVGKAYCVQAKDAIRNVGRTAAFVCGKAVAKAVAGKGLQYLAKTAVRTSGKRFLGAAVGVVIEGGLLIHDIYEARQQLNKGKISDTDYWNIIKKTCSTRACAAAGATIGGAVGLLVPIPILNTAVGLVGAAIGGVIGAAVGALIGSACLQTN